MTTISWGSFSDPSSKYDGRVTSRCSWSVDESVRRGRGLIHEVLAVDPALEFVRDVAAPTMAAHPDRPIIVDAQKVIEVGADRLRLHQALAALVDNAVRHTPDDSSIQVAATRTDGHIELPVAHSGPGLTTDEATAVFDRFSRGDLSRAHRTGGSGLGLSITQAIVHAHRGEISVTATPGEGATFTIVLPIESTH